MVRTMSHCEQNDEVHKLTAMAGTKIATLSIRCSSRVLLNTQILDELKIPLASSNLAIGHERFSLG